MVRGPEVTGGGDFRRKLVKVDFLGGSEGGSQTISYFGILAPCSIGSNSLGVVEEAVFFSD